MSRFFLRLLLVVWFSLLTAAAIEMYRPPEWAIHPESNELTDAPLNLTERLEQAQFKRTPTSVTEAEINRLLAAAITPRNRYSWIPAFESSRAVLTPNGFEVRLLWRTSRGHPLTSSLEFTVERKNNTFVIEPSQGAYGSLPLPRGFLSPMLPTLNKLVKALKPEIDMAFQMHQIHFEQGRIAFDPRPQQPAK